MKVDFELIDSILKDHSYDATQVIGIMQDIQKEYRYLPEEGLKYAAEKIGIRKGIARLSDIKINSKTNFFKDYYIIRENVINTRHNLATIIDVYNERQAYYREAAGSNTCYLVTPLTHGDGLKVKTTCWNDDAGKAAGESQAEKQ